MIPFPLRTKEKSLEEAWSLTAFKNNISTPKSKTVTVGHIIVTPTLDKACSA